MLTREEDIDAHALAAQGCTISAIARHLGRDRETIRAHLSGERTAGVRAKTVPDAFDPFADYAAARLTEDPHLWASALADELEPLGWTGGYSTLTRQIRDRGLRPRCEQCGSLKDRPVAVIDHPPGAETQFDWLELPDPPEHWGWGKHAHLLAGASRTPDAGAVFWPSPKNKRTSPSPSMPSPTASAGSRGPGVSIGCRPSPRRGRGG